jgi:adenosine deaminase
VTDEAFRTQVIGARSMDGFDSAGGERTRSFLRDVPRVRRGHQRQPVGPLADVMDKAGRQHESYVETMTTRQGWKVSKLAGKVAFTGDFAEMRRQVLAGGLADIVTDAIDETNDDEADYRREPGCGTAQASPGCG